MTPTNVNMTSLATAEANQLAAVQAWIPAKNAQLASEYLGPEGPFADWLALYKARSVPWNATPPAPPNGYKSVGYQKDEGDDTSWPFAIRDGGPVCSVPDYAKVEGPVPAGHIHVGVIQPGAFADPARTQPFYSRGADDTVTVNGSITPPVTSDDGTRGIFQYDAYPFGAWYILLQKL